MQVIQLGLDGFAHFPGRLFTLFRKRQAMLAEFRQCSRLGGFQLGDAGRCGGDGLQLFAGIHREGDDRLNAAAILAPQAVDQVEALLHFLQPLGVVFDRL